MMSTRAFPFLGLNAVRCLSMVSLILVFASTITVMFTNINAVNAYDAAGGPANERMQDCDYIEGSTVPNQPAGVFWAIVSSLLIIFQTIVLLLSEVGWPAAFFDRFFPVLGSNFGLGALGIFQCLISTQILSHHVDDFTLVSAFLLFAIGCLNMLLGLIFREKAKTQRSISIWRSENKGLLPTAHSNSSQPVFVPANSAYLSRQPTGSSEKSRPDTNEFGLWKSGLAPEKSGYGFGRQGEKAAGLRGFILQKPEESLPRYATPTPSNDNHKRQESVHSRQSSISSTSSCSSFGSPHRKSGRSSNSIKYPEERDRHHEHLAAVKTPKFKSSPMAL